MGRNMEEGESKDGVEERKENKYWSLSQIISSSFCRETK
jgi:hypothetical protein